MASASSSGASAYESIGGHGAVRDQVAEDVALAQRLFAAAKRTELILGRDELTTRMYTSLREIMAGWRKNVFAGGREAMPWGRVGQVIFPALLLLVPAADAPSAAHAPGPAPRRRTALAPARGDHRARRPGSDLGRGLPMDGRARARSPLCSR